MSNRVKQNLCFIRLLAETTSKAQRKALLETATKQQLKTLVEITYNILQLHFPVSKTYQNKLIKRGHVLEGIVDRRKKERQRDRYIKKHLSTILLIVKASLPALNA